MANLTYKLKNLWYYYWGKEDGKYVSDENGNYIVFLDKSFSYVEKNTTSWSYKKL